MNKQESIKGNDTPAGSPPRRLSLREKIEMRTQNMRTEEKNDIKNVLQETGENMDAGVRMLMSGNNLETQLSALARMYGDDKQAMHDMEKLHAYLAAETTDAAMVEKFLCAHQTAREDELLREVWNADKFVALFRKLNSPVISPEAAQWFHDALGNINVSKDPAERNNLRAGFFALLNDSERTRWYNRKKLTAYKSVMEPTGIRKSPSTKHVRKDGWLE